MMESPSLLNNPAVVGSGIGGLIAVMLIAVLYRMLTRIDDSIHTFNSSQTEVVKGLQEAGKEIGKTLSDAMIRIHEDNVEVVRALDRVGGKMDVLLDRSSRTFEQIAIHRGAVERAATGTPPAIIVSPIKEYPDDER